MLTIEFDKERLRRTFPRLAEEIDSDEKRTKVNSIRTDVQVAEGSVSQNFVHYNPDAVDFIRRCDTEKQAEEIIQFMEKRREIDKTYAEKLRNQLKQRGVRSFGSKKEADYYLKHGDV